MPEHLRLYTFCNMYLSSIQCGIQSAHIVGEMFTKYYENFDPIEYNHLYNWAEHNKTIIVLNGGYQSELNKIYEDFTIFTKELKLPYAKFYEEEDALNKALTCVGIILPESIYNGYEFNNSDVNTNNMLIDDCWNNPKYRLANIIKSKKLAN